MSKDVEKARAEFAKDRYVIVGDDSGHEYVIPMARRSDWTAFMESDEPASGEVPAYAMRIEGTLTFKDPTIVYDVWPAA